MIRQQVIPYGSEIDRDPSKTPIYNIINQFFGNPQMTKIKNIMDPEDGEYSLYYCRVESQLGGNNYRYLVAISPVDNRPKGKAISLINLEWDSFQTCTLEELHQIPIHRYSAVKPVEMTSVDTGMTKINGDVDETIYFCNSLPLQVTIIHSGNIDSITCPDKADLLQGLQSFQTVISWK